MYPFLSLFGLSIPMYGLCMFFAILIAIIYSSLKARKKGICFEDVLIVAAFALGSAILCGNLLYIAVTFSFSQIISFIKSGDFSFITSGGIVFYGGLIGGIGGAFIGAKVAGTKLAEFDDIVVPCLPLCHAIGRVGCLLAGCCYGMEYYGPFSIYYKNSVFGLASNIGHFPVQPLEALLDIAIALFLFHYAKRKRPPFFILCKYISLYAIMRFCTEFFRGDSVRGIFGALSTSQWISIGLLATSITIRLLIKHKKRSNI
ncbi:MAG: prolipoprotein diacylglyceryl transferase [Clostridia bacterium]|nr:prolipoprotein diacylglyceryl transferase [Clostridia bacterium]